MMRQIFRHTSRRPTAASASLRSSHQAGTFLATPACVVKSASTTIHLERLERAVRRNSRAMALAAGILVLASGPVHADVHRFFSGQHPAGAANPALCTDQAEPWYPTVADACQGIKSVLPACDRSSAIYRNYVATLAGSGLCNVSWEYANVNNPGVWNSFGASYGVTTQTCPGNSTQTGASCLCDAGFVTDPQNPSSCVAVTNTINLNKASSSDSCRKNPGVGNPIYPLTGAKVEYVDTGVGLGGLNLSLVYDTTLKVPANQADTASAMAGPNSFGALWKSSFHHRLVVSTGATRALLSRGDGKILNFIGNGAGAFTTEADNTHKLVSIAGGYRFTDVATGDQETFDSAGFLQSLARGNGMVLSFVHSGANLTKVQSSDGRVVRFSYTHNLITRITDANGRTIVPAYDGNRNLVSLTWQDGKASQFLYENTSFPWAMTGKVDENNTRYATFTYDAQGRATASEHAGGVGRYSVSYTQPPQLVVTDSFNTATRVLSRQHDWQMPGGTTLQLPNGQSSSIGAASVMGLPSVTSQSQPAGSGCAAATSTMSYDANGNIASLDDFNGQRSCFTNDLSRNLPTVTVEGLANTANCATVLMPNASLPAGSRKVSTQWHPDLSLATRAAQSLSLTTSVYNGQPDPFNGNAPASCAPTAAKTPDGKPIAVLCKQVVQATTDADGHLGLAAALDAGVTQRVSSFTYDALGRMLTSTDPLSRVTTYSYYSNSTDFSDPSVTSDVSFDSVSLLLHGDGANNSIVIADSGAAPKPMTAGGNSKISTAQSKFGGASIFLPGVSANIVITPTSSAFDFGSGDVTVEAWFYIAGDSPADPDGIKGGFIASTWSAAAHGGWMLAIGGNTTTTGTGLAFDGWDAAGVNGSLHRATVPISKNTWHHVAAVVAGGIKHLFLDGVKQTSTTITVGTGYSHMSGFGALAVGGSLNSQYPAPFNGYIDDLRITKGVARYAANFTPSTQAYPNTGPAIDPNAVGHTAGDLQSITNAAGHVTQFTLYDRAGRVRQMIDPNGVITDTVYTPRGWVSSVAVTAPGGTARTTAYTYDNAGQLTGATLPDGSSLGYSYDAAHRLTGVTDAKGNTVTYTLDNMGNKVGEQVKDPSGSLQRNITRVYDALNRVQQVTGASN